MKISGKNYSPMQQRLAKDTPAIKVRTYDKPQRTVQYAKGKYIQVDYDVSDTEAIERAYRNEAGRNNPTKRK
jgi:hypothetical protein